MEQNIPEITGHHLHETCTLVLKRDNGAALINCCAACKRDSSGAWWYSCDSCGFHLHRECATAPDDFPFWGHPHHRLTLVKSRPDLASYIRSSTRSNDAEALVASSKFPDGRIPVYCVICTNEICGMHYQCAPCGVFLHPVCVQLKVMLRSEAHPQHNLTLVCTFPTMCGVCHSPSIWCYRCFRCLVFSGFHPNCLPENHRLLGDPYTTEGSNGVPDRTRLFGRILPPIPPPPPRMFVDQAAPFAGVNPLGIMDPFNRPRQGPSTTPSIMPDPCGGAFPYSGEYGRSTFGQG